MVRLAPAGWKKERLQADQDVQPYDVEQADSVSDRESALDLGEANRSGVRRRPVGLSPLLGSDAVEFAPRTLHILLRSSPNRRRSARIPATCGCLPSGEDRPISSRVGSELRVMANLSPCRLAGSTLPAAAFLKPSKKQRSSPSGNRPNRREALLSLDPPCATIESGRAASIIPWVQILPIRLPSSDYRNSTMIFVKRSFSPPSFLRESCRTL